MSQEEVTSPGASTGGGESRLTVVLALSANVAVAVAKTVAGVLSGSAAMLSEAAHSVADCGTEVFLLTALARSAKPADRGHPFGYGKERFFWSLLAAVSIFTAGAVFSLYQGVTSLTGHAEPNQDPRVGYIVIAVAAALEGTSLVQAIRQVRTDQSKDRLALLPYLRHSDDPTIKTVLYEDSAAITGLVLAFAGLWLTQLTGSHVYDGVASLLIGLLLVVVAYGLGRTNKDLLIGRQADTRLMAQIEQWLNNQPEVDVVVDMLTMLTGTDKVLLCARLDVINTVSASDLEHACMRMDTELRSHFEELDAVFLQPVPRDDQVLRARVHARYGTTHTDSPSAAAHGDSVVHHA